MHSPVRRVNYKIEAARLGRATDYERLVLEVWTNGTVSPEDAVSMAAQLLQEHLNIFMVTEKSAPSLGAGVSVTLSPEMEAILNKSVDSSSSPCARSTR